MKHKFTYLLIYLLQLSVGSIVNDFLDFQPVLWLETSVSLLPSRSCSRGVLVSVLN